MTATANRDRAPLGAPIAASTLHLAKEYIMSDRHCRDCKRCTSVMGAGATMDWVLALFTCGLWLIVMVARKRCPICRHYAKVHTGTDLVGGK